MLYLSARKKKFVALHRETRKWVSCRLDVWLKRSAVLLLFMSWAEPFARSSTTTVLTFTTFYSMEIHKQREYHQQRQCRKPWINGNKTTTPVWLQLRPCVLVPFSKIAYSNAYEIFLKISQIPRKFTIVISCFIRHFGPQVGQRALMKFKSIS